MFERFTDRARRVVVLAQEEARLLNHNYIGTEHLLLGVLHEGEGVAGETLERLGVSLETARSEVKGIIGQGQSAPTGHIPFTPRAKKVLELSLREALQLGHNYIGTEHILLGLVRERDGVAAQVLAKFGADLAHVRQQVIEVLSVRGEEPSGTRPAMGMARPPVGARHARSRGSGVPRLVRVVPIAREENLSPGLRLALVCLEIWSDWVDLRASLFSSDVEQRAPVAGAGLEGWALADDLGTEYRCLGTAVGGDAAFRVLETAFVPAPPAAATSLTLTLPAGEGHGEVRTVLALRER